MSVVAYTICWKLKRFTEMSLKLSICLDFCGGSMPWQQCIDNYSYHNIVFFFFFFWIVAGSIFWLHTTIYRTVGASFPLQKCMNCLRMQLVQVSWMLSIEFWVFFVAVCLGLLLYNLYKPNFSWGHHLTLCSEKLDG